MHLKVDAQGDLFTVWLNSKKIMEQTIPEHPAGKVGLRLSSADAAHSVRFTNWLRPQGWKNIVVRDLATGKILATDSDVHGVLDEQERRGWRVDFRGILTTQGGSYYYFGDPRWKDYSLDVDFVNPYVGVIAMRVGDDDSGAILFLQPFNYGAVSWAGIRGSRVRVNVPTIFFAKQIIFRLFCIYLVACGIILGGLVVSVLAFLLFSLMDICRLGPVLAMPIRFFTLQWVRRWAKRAGIVVIAVLAIAFLALSVWIMVGPHEKMPHVQDSVVYLFQAKMNALGHFYMPIPRIIDSLKFQFMVAENGKWYGKYSPGFPLLLVPGVLAGTPWIVPPVLGFLCFISIVAFTLRLYSFPETLLTAILALVCPFFLFLSGSFMNHVTCLLGVMLFLYFLIRMEQEGRRGYGFLAGFFLGYAILTRTLSPMTIALPWVVWQGLYIFRRGRRLETLKRFLLMGAGLAIPVGFLLWYNYHLTGDPLLFPFNVYSANDRLGFGKNVGSFGGHMLWKGLMNAESNLLFLVGHLFGWPHYMTLAFLIIPFVLATLNRWDWLLLGSWASIAIIHVFHWGHPQKLYGPRYWFEAMPAFLILTARGVTMASGSCGKLAERLKKNLVRPAYVANWSHIIATASILIFMAWLIKGNIAGYFSERVQEHRGYNGVDARMLHMVEDNEVHDAVVFVKSKWPWQNYGSVFSSNSPMLDSDVVYVRDIDDYKNGLVMKEFPGREYYVADYRENKINRMSGEQEQRCMEAARKSVPVRSRTSRAVKKEIKKKEPPSRPVPGAAQANAPGDGPGRYKEPRGMAIDRDGAVYVADFRNYRIQKLDKDGSFIRAWGEKGSGPGQFRDPCDVAISDEGLVYVADTFNNRVQVFDADGNFARQFKGGFFAPRGIAVDSKGHVWIADTGNNMVKVFSAGGEPILEIGRKGRESEKDESGAFRRPIGVASNGAGKMYVADSGNRRVQVFDEDGTYLSEFAVDGWEKGPINEPYVAVDGRGDVYVTDPPGQRVLRYSSEGTLLGKLEPMEKSKPLMHYPVGIAVEPRGDGVYIVDCRNHMVRKFSKSDFK
jgi:DNA-binding beta-propeller fold protein YncE